MSCHTRGKHNQQHAPDACCLCSISVATASHPVVFLPQLLCLLLVRLLLTLGQFAPHFAEFLCAVADGQTRILLLDAGTVLAAEHEERRPATQPRVRLAGDAALTATATRGQGSGPAGARGSDLWSKTVLLVVLNHDCCGLTKDLKHTSSSDLRGSLGCVGVFPLAAPLSKALWGDVVSHLPVVADLVGFGHVLETLLITCRQSLKSEQTLTLACSAPSAPGPARLRIGRPRKPTRLSPSTAQNISWRTRQS